MLYCYQCFKIMCNVCELQRSGVEFVESLFKTVGELNIDKVDELVFCGWHLWNNFE